MTALSQRSADHVVHDSLVTMSSRLEDLWRQSCTGRVPSVAGPGAAGGPPARAAVADGAAAGVAAQEWHEALGRLVLAMTALEGYAARLDPSLGRRDWRCREAGPGRRHGDPPSLPRQRRRSA